MSDYLFHLAWTTYWQSLLLAGIVLLITRFFRDQLQPRFRYLLWCAVLLRFAFPILPTTSWGIFESHYVAEKISNPSVFETENPAERESRTFPVVRESSFANPENGPFTGGNSPDSLSTGIPTERSEISGDFRSAIIPVKIPWKAGIVGIWLLGFLFLFARYLFDEIELLRQSRNWKPVADPALFALFQQVREHLGVKRRVRFLLVEEDIGAASCGFLRPTVLISKRALETISTEQLSLVLLHEMVHLKRHDPFVLRSASILKVIYWPHPAIWFVFSRLQRERELACDAAVLHTLDTKFRDNPSDSIPGLPIQKRYGEAVLSFAERFSTGQVLPGLVGASQDYGRRSTRKHTITRRIEMILKYKRNKTSHAVFGLLLLGLLLAFGLTKAGGKQQTPEHEQNTTQNIPASSGKTETQTEGTAVVRGRVLDPDGKPIEGALMVWTTEPNDYWDNRSQAVKTDENGNYQSPELKAIPGAITVIAEGFAPEMKKVRFHSGMKPVDFTLKKGKTLEIHFVDPEGKPVPEVHLSMGGNPDPFWRTDSNIYAGFGADVILGAKIPDTKIPCKADENGVYRWTWAPEDRVRFNFSRENFLPIYTDAYSPEEENWILPGKKVHRITMYPEISASGSVLDADTGKPIGSFRVVPGNIMKNYSPGGIIWQTGQGGEFSGGTFEYHFNAYRKEGYRLRISAEGYDPAVSGDILPGSPNPKFEFRLKKSAGLSAKVLLPDGSPASGAKVFVSGSGGYLQVTDPPNSYLTQDDRMSAQTDAEGRFTIYRDPEERFGIYCEHPKGIGWGTYGEFLKNREIRLHGFAKKIEILLPEKIRETENLRAWLQPEDLGRDGFGHIDYQLIVKPGTKSIVFENIVAGKYEFTLSAPSPSHEWVRGSTAWNLLSASLRIGEDESRVLDLSKPGPTIMGKVVLPDSVSEPMSARDWNYNLAELFFEESGERPIREMRAYLEPSPEDSRVGIFRFDSLPEGEYAVRISVNLYKAPEESRTMDAGFSQPLASFKEELRVSGDRNPLEIELGR